jgi:hypothetical protein
VADGGGSQRFGKAQDRVNGDSPESDDPDGTSNDSDLSAFEEHLTGLYGIGDSNVRKAAEQLNNDPAFVSEMLDHMDSVESYETADVDRLAAEVGDERAAELREVFPNKTDEQLIAFEG